MKRPTLHDVAREAGVSHMTVSRVVRGTHTVRSVKVERVEGAIAKLGYRPDPALSALAAYRSKEGGGQGSILAFLDCDRTPYSRVVFQGVRQEAMLYGYEVERLLLAPGISRQKQMARMLYHRGVRGLFFGPSDKLWEFSGWDWKEFAMVSLGAVTHRPAMHSVAMDYFHGAAKACRLLQGAGCRRVALVVDPRLETRSSHRWLGGYLAARGEEAKACVYQGDLASRSDLRAWVRREKIDGVLTIHGAVWKNLRDLGLRFAFLNDSFTVPGAPFPVLNPETIGAEGMRVLHHLLLRREFGLPQEPKMVALQGRWQEEFPGSA